MFHMYTSNHQSYVSTSADTYTYRALRDGSRLPSRHQPSTLF